MSKRSIKKLRHRTDIVQAPSFKNRMLAGQNGETVCINPKCRKFFTPDETELKQLKHCGCLNKTVETNNTLTETQST